MDSIFFFFLLKNEYLFWYSNFATVSVGQLGQPEPSHAHVIGADDEMTLIALLQSSSNSNINSWKHCILSRTKEKSGETKAMNELKNVLNTDI